MKENLRHFCTLRGSNVIWEIQDINYLKNVARLKNNNKTLIISTEKIETIKDTNKIIDTGRISISLNTNSVSNEIMLRHKTKEDALECLDRFISDSLSHGIPVIKIIHGKNGGIIRNAVHNYLKSSPFVSSYRLGYYYEGSLGVTIATLQKQN